MELFDLGKLIDLEDIPAWLERNPVFAITLVAIVLAGAAATIYAEGFRRSLLAFFGWLDRNVEKVIILVNYVLMALIIFVEVIRRFVLKEQAPWSTTIPIYLFLWIVWIGCAYNVRIRTHLRFDEIRARLPYLAQFACLMLDAVLWIVFSLIVIYYTFEQVVLMRDNYAIVQGTDDVLLWWFYIATPLAFCLLIFRCLQNIYDDVRTLLNGEPFRIQVSVMGD